jgi:hypothetical protein
MRFAIALLVALPLIVVDENCSRYVCRQLPNGRMDCSEMNACIARNKAKERERNPDGKAPGKTRPMHAPM